MKLVLPKDLKNAFQINLNLWVLLPVILMIVSVVGEIYFYVATLNPAMVSNDKVSTELAKVNKLLAVPNRIPATSADTARAQLANVQATLTASLNAFLPDDQASNILSAFSQYAQASNVQVLNLQSQPATTVKDLYTVTLIKLQVQGESSKLVAFASRMKEAFSAKGLVLNNITLLNGDTPTALMTLDIALYTTSVRKSQAMTVSEQSRPNVAVPPAPISSPTPVPPQPATPVPTILSIPPTATLIPPTPVPVYPTAVPSSVHTTHLVRAGETLFSISQRYGTSIQAIMLANQLPNYTIYIGQSLQIPTR